jgi:nitrogen-specific signal transduction histidine kinase
MVIYISTLIQNACVMAKFSDVNYKILGIRLCSASDWQALISFIVFISDLYFASYIYLSLLQTIKMYALIWIYSVIHRFAHGDQLSWTIISLHFVLKAIAALHMHTKERIERKHFLLSKKLRIYKNSWESLFKEAKNPIIIISNKKINVSNIEFEDTFLKNYPHTIQGVLTCFSKIYNGVQNLKTIVENFMKKEDGNHIEQFKNIGIFKFEGPDSIQSFDISYKNVCWKKDKCVYLHFKNVTVILKNQKDALSKQYRNILLTTASHEIRNPLNGILGGLELVFEDSKSFVNEKSRSQYVKAIKSNSELLSNVIYCLNDYCMYESGNLVMNPSQFSLLDLIKYCTSLLEPQSQERGVRIDINYESACQYLINSDKERIKQIYLNLLTNSVKYTFSGVINVNIVDIGELISISIHDTGIGIRDEMKSTLFKLFGKLDNSIDGIDAGAGAGLGLTISQALAKELGTGISFESEYKKGSKFEFSLAKDVINKLPSPRLMSKGNYQNKMPSNIEKDEFIVNKNLSKICLKNADNCREKGYNLKIDKLNMQAQIKYQPISKMTVALANSNLNDTEKIDEENENVDMDSESILNEFNNPHEANVGLIISHSFIKAESPFSSFKKIIKTKSAICVSKPEVLALAVDDNSFNLVVLEGLLKKIGIRVKKAFNGKEALALMDECARSGMALKVVLMDCEMPVMNGFEAALEMKKG